MSKATVLSAAHPKRGTLFAVVDPAAHHVAGKIAERRFGAFLSPFTSEADAKAALIAEGCANV